MIVIDYLARTGKTLEQFIEDINDVVGAFSYGRNDLKLTEEKKQAILKYCESTDIKSMADIKVEQIEILDGFKYHLEGERVLMIRASGTEPLLRVYCQAESNEKVKQVLDKIKKVKYYDKASKCYRHLPTVYTINNNNYA